MKKLVPFSLFMFLILVLGCSRPLNTADKCKDMACQNEGTCADGVCQCPDGYSGDLCDVVSPGWVKGTINPHTIVENLLLTGITTATVSDSYQVTSDADGSFLFINVHPGGYILHINTYPDSDFFWLPPSIGTSVIVSAGDTTNVGLITIPYNEAAQTGTVTYSVNGGPIHTLNYRDFTASYNGDGLSIGGKEGGDPNNTFGFGVGGVTGPGSYQIHYTSTMVVRCTNPSGKWGTGQMYGYSDALLTISSLDTSTRRISGSFNASLNPIQPTVNGAYISGSFTNVSYPPQ